MTPRLRAEDTGLTVILLIFIRRYCQFLKVDESSVLEELRERKLADIQDETREIVDSREQRPEVQSEAEKEVKTKELSIISI